MTAALVICGCLYQFGNIININTTVHHDVTLGGPAPYGCRHVGAIGGLISRRVGITDKAGFCRRVSVARFHGPARAGFVPISAGKASLVILIKITILFSS